MNAWIFDVDGVIVNPASWKIEELGIIDEITKKIIAHDPVIFISGRGVVFQHNTIISLVQKCLENLSLPASLLENVYLSGEFGGTSISYTHGKLQENTNQSLILPDGIIQD